jgi:hypothetical protein
VRLILCGEAGRGKVRKGRFREVLERKGYVTLPLKV